MLNKLRKKKTAKRIWITLAILIIPAFIFWGTSSMTRNKEETLRIGRISGKNISFSEYRAALDATRSQAIIQFGDNFAEIEKSLNLESQAWERLILLTEAKKRKITASDEEVIGLIQSYPFFKSSKGQFDNQFYLQTLQYVFRTPARTFEEQERQNLIIYKLYQDITKTINLSDAEVKEEYRKLNEEISIAYIAALSSTFQQEVTVTGEELKDYFKANSLLFKQPLSFNIEYVSLSVDDKNEEEIKNKTKEILLRLDKKEDFSKVAQDFELTVTETGLFAEANPIPGIGWSPQISSLLSKTETGSYLPAIYMDNVYYILKVKEKKEPYLPDFEVVKEKVKEMFTRDKSQEIAKEKIENSLKKLKELYEANPSSVNFDEVAQLYGLKSASTGLFKYGSYIEGIGASDIFWMTAQKLKDNEFSEPLDAPAGFYIIKVKSRVPIENNKFEAEKTEFAQKLLMQKKEEYFADFLRELKNKAQRFLN